MKTGKRDENILLIANEKAGYETVQRVIEEGYSVQAVFTSHSKRRHKIADYVDFSPLEKKYKNIPFHYILDPKESLVIEEMLSYGPDLILVISWSQILSKEIVDFPRLGTVGVHYSLLPERRGGAPLVWAIIDGLEKTGLTLFYYDEGIDTGDIIDQIELKITQQDTVKSLLEKIEIALPPFVLKNLDAILEGANQRIKQDESKASYTKARTPKDGEIDWSLTREQIYNFIRAQTLPYPCAYTKVIDKNGNSKELVIPCAKLEDDKLIIEGFVEDIE
jgi:methionyl-tRNA formyltransferase